MKRFFLIALLALQACTSLGPSSPAGRLLDTFTMNGRLSVRHAEDSFSGSLDWTSASGHDELLFSTPLGQGMASLTRTAEGVTLTPAGKEPVHAQTADELTKKTLGFRLPLAGLRFWIQGHPDPKRHFESTVAENGGITRLKQDGWVIDYLQYRDNRPRKILVTRDDLEIRLVIDSWQAN